MKNSKSKFIAGFVAGSLLFGATGVYAGSSGKLIEVFYNVKGITVNKTAQKLSEDNITGRHTYLFGLLLKR